MPQVTITYSSWLLTNEGEWALLWIFQATSILILIIHLATTFFMPFDSYNILLGVIKEMIKEDVSVYMSIFLWFFTGFYVALYLLYPRSGTRALPFVPSFNTDISAFLDLLRLSILGESPDIHPLLEAVAPLSWPQGVALVLWLVVYYGWLILSVILMINLLIAMLTNTFDTAFTEATLKSRMAFAIGVMKLEKTAQSLGMKSNVHP